MNGFVTSGLSRATSFSQIDCHKSDREIEIAIDMYFNYILPLCTKIEIEHTKEMHLEEKEFDKFS